MNLYRVTDGGEEFLYITWDKKKAREMHRDLFYTQPNIDNNDIEWEDDIVILDDYEYITIDGTTRSSELWAQLEDEGLLGASIY